MCQYSSKLKELQQRPLLWYANCSAAPLYLNLTFVLQTLQRWALRFSYRVSLFFRQNVKQLLMYLYYVTNVAWLTECSWRARDWYNAYILVSTYMKWTHVWNNLEYPEFILLEELRVQISIVSLEKFDWKYTEVLCYLEYSNDREKRRNIWLEIGVTQPRPFINAGDPATNLK